MKKILCYGFMILCALYLTACSEGQAKGDEKSFKAEVVEVDNKSVTVIPAEDEEIRKSADRVRFEKEHVKNGEQIKVGDKIMISYGGTVEEVYPAHIHAFRWALLEAAVTPEADNKNMIMYNNKIYVDTGDVSNLPRCGTGDFEIETCVRKGIPVKNLQSNFGKGYKCQYGLRENQIDVCIDEQWHIFACNENDLSNVSMKVVNNTNHSLKIEIENEVEELECGEDYQIEYYDPKYDCWTLVSYKNENAGFDDVKYVLNQGTNEYAYDWEYLYGKLKKGKYRIVKIFHVLKSGEKTESHVLTAEFEIK